MIPGPRSTDEIKRLVDTAGGRRAPDMLITGGRVVNVHTLEVVTADVSIAASRIAYVGAAPAMVDDHTTVVDAAGSYVLPTYIEPHCHPWMLYNPDALARFALALGTTAHVAELLNLQLLLGTEEVGSVWRALQNTPVRWYWAVRTAGQAGEDVDEWFPRPEVERLLADPATVQVAEITGWPQLLAADPILVDRVALAGERGLRVDGHGAGASRRRIPALAAAGFTADHESITEDDVLERLRAGLHVFLRNSSLRPDLDQFVDMCKQPRFAAQMSLTTDGSGPDWLFNHGMIDGLVRKLVAAGVPIPLAVRYASLNPATYLRLDEHLGSVTPGRCADLQILPDFDGSPPTAVLVDGTLRAREGRLVDEWPALDWGSHRGSSPIDAQLAHQPDSYRPRGAGGDEVAVMRLTSAGVARREQAVLADDGSVADALHVVLFSPDGKYRSAGWIRGFAPELDGLATTYTNSMGLLVIGRDPAEMARAAASVYPGQAGAGGGIAVAQSGRIVARLGLDIAYTMSSKPFEEVAHEWRPIEDAVRRAGYPFDELLYCLFFITCDFLPDLRLVPAGMLDVKPYRLLVPAERLDSVPGRD